MYSYAVLYQLYEMQLRHCGKKLPKECFQISYTFLNTMMKQEEIEEENKEIETFFLPQIVEEDQLAR